MAAMFLRNKYVGWYAARSSAPHIVLNHLLRSSVVFAIQSWLAESPDAAKAKSQPAIFSVGMSCEPILSSRVSYLTDCLRSIGTYGGM